MALTNAEIVTRALSVLVQGLKPYMQRELYTKGEFFQVKHADDPYELLKLFTQRWSDVFGGGLSQLERSQAHTLLEYRNRAAHAKEISYDDLDMALSAMVGLLAAIGAKAESDQVDSFRWKKRQEQIGKRASQIKQRAVRKATEGTPTGGLKPWREVIAPHPDVASGNFTQAEFAADLYEVHQGRGAKEYSDPDAFFRRTYMTGGLSYLLVESMRRLTGQGGIPVFEMQTNFGGGKTHSMLALLHLYSGAEPDKLLGVAALMDAAGVRELPKVRSAVIVGNRTIPIATPQKREPGVTVNTLWGEIAYQLGGREGYEMVREADVSATSPGDALRQLFERYAPCLILIDEWVAYARQFDDKKEFCGGTFATQMTFAQTLTEAAKAAPQTMLVVSLPESDQQQGGQKGIDAHREIRRFVARIDAPWRPASKEESYEIVRRRLFEDIRDPDAVNAVVRAFEDLYSRNKADFGIEYAEKHYSDRMKDCYPIHPELFDRLYEDWGSMPDFQQTRGVLRLMAKVIQTLWDREDRNILIMPGMLPLDDPQVEGEITHYLETSWKAVIDTDVDGDAALSRQLDAADSRLGQVCAGRRVARTIFLRSGPTLGSANKGLEDKQIWLGCVQPGEPIAAFADALRRLTDRATHLYADKQRFWFSTQPSVNRLAQDRAQQGGRQEQAIEEIQNWLKVESKTRGEFARVHACPANGAAVSDEMACGLVIMRPDCQHIGKNFESEAVKEADAILANKGAAPRMYKNTLIFLAPDARHIGRLIEAMKLYLAWKSIWDEQESLNLDNFQRTLAHSQLNSAQGTVREQLREVYCWLLIPDELKDNLGKVEWRDQKLQCDNGLAASAARKLKGTELIVEFGGAALKHELDQVLWRDSDHISIRQLQEDFARYLYLPRLKEPEVIVQTVTSWLAGDRLFLDSFAYADAWDETRQRYVGLRACSAKNKQAPAITGLLVKPDVARLQLEAEEGESKAAKGEQAEAAAGDAVDPPATQRKPNRFYLRKQLDQVRWSRDIDQLSKQFIERFSKLENATVHVNIEVEATALEGFDDKLRQDIEEDCRSLKVDGRFETDEL